MQNRFRASLQPRERISDFARGGRVSRRENQASIFCSELSPGG
jgi:hypothetical protein